MKYQSWQGTGLWRKTVRKGKDGIHCNACLDLHQGLFCNSPRFEAKAWGRLSTPFFAAIVTGSFPVLASISMGIDFMFPGLKKNLENHQQRCMFNEQRHGKQAVESSF
jgi:hypothetical protein